jgi:hypothetical protein
MSGIGHEAAIDPTRWLNGMGSSDPDKTTNECEDDKR